MDRAPPKKFLMAEQQYVLGMLIENGKIVELAAYSYLITPVSPMSIKFLQAIRLYNLIYNGISIKLKLLETVRQSERNSADAFIV